MIGGAEPDGPVRFHNYINGQQASELQRSTIVAKVLGAVTCIGSCQIFGAHQLLIEKVGDICPVMANKPSFDLVLCRWRSHAQVGQRPFEMGLLTPDVMIELIAGKKEEGPLYTGVGVCNQEDSSFCANN